MNKSFSLLYENFVNRHAQGGFLIGDYITLKKDVLKCPELSQQHKDLLKQLIQSKERIRIVNIQPKNSNLSALPNGTTADYNVIIAPEIHPGLNGGNISIPMYCIELETKWDDAPTKPFPDKLTRNNNHQANLNTTQKFSDIYDSGKGSQSDLSNG